METKWTNSQNVRLGLGTWLRSLSAYASVINFDETRQQVGEGKAKRWLWRTNNGRFSEPSWKNGERPFKKNYEITISNFHIRKKLLVD